MSEDKTSTRTRLLSNRGIGKAYHFRSLSDYEGEHARQVLDIVNSYEAEHVIAGQGFNIFGESVEAYDMAMLLSRALILKNMHLFVVDYCNLVDPDNEVFSVLAEKGFPPLTIMDFRAESTYTEVKVYNRLETILKKHYLNEHKPVIIHFPYQHNPSGKAVTVGDLMSQNLFDRLLRVNITIAV